MPTLVIISYSEDESLIGAEATIVEIQEDSGETDYRVVTKGGHELWIPAEHVVVIS